MSLVAIDSETFFITEDCKTPRLVCMSVAVDGEPAPFLLDRVEAYNWWTKDATLTDTYVFHNAPFDLAVFRNEMPAQSFIFWELYERGLIRDTSIREKLLDIRRGTLSSEKGAYSLATLANKYCGVKLDKDEGGWRMRYHELAEVPIKEWPERAVKYALEDAQYTLEVYKAQERMFESSPLPPGEEERQVKAHWALHLTSLRGLRADVQSVQSLEERLDKAIKLARVKLHANGIFHKQKKDPTMLKLSKEGEPMKNMAIIKGLVEKAYGTKGIPVPKTEKGNVCTDATTLEESGCDVLETLASISNDTKIKTSYLPLLRNCTTKRIQTNFNPLLETGRTSSFKPNVQQWPRNGAVRECLVPEDGYVFVSCDYDTLELRCLAQILLWRFGDSAMARAIKSGRDLHLMVAAQLSGLEYDEAFDRFQKDDEQVLENRQRAKVANFGFAGGMGAATFVKYAAGAGLNITLDEAFKLRTKWLETWPEMHRYFQVAAERTGDFGDKTLTCWVSGRQVSGISFSAYCNYQFQALAADGAKGALYETVKLCLTHSDSAMFGSHPYNFVHDQIILESPRQKASAAGEELQRVMISEMQKWLPDIPVSASSVLMERWYKKAKTVRNDRGELEIWKPKG